MKIIVGCTATIITLVILGVLIRKSNNRSFENVLNESLYQSEYLLFMTVSNACLIVIEQYIQINSAFYAFILIALIFIVNRFCIKIMDLDIGVNVRGTLVCLSLLLSIFYFSIQAYVEKSDVYIEMIGIAVAILLGFYVGLDNILPDNSCKEICKDVFENIGLYRIKPATYGVVLLIFIYLVIYAVIEHTSIGQMIKIPLALGIIAGFVIEIILIKISKKM